MWEELDEKLIPEYWEHLPYFFNVEGSIYHRNPVFGTRDALDMLNQVQVQLKEDTENVHGIR